MLFPFRHFIDSFCYIFPCINLTSTIVALPYPTGSTWMYTIWGCLRTNLRVFSLIHVVFEKKIKTSFICSCIKLYLPLWSHPTLGGHDLNNFELIHTIWGCLHTNLKVFWPNSFLEDYQRLFYIFLWTSQCDPILP